MNVFEFVKHKCNVHSLWMSVGTVLAGTSAAVIRGNMEVMPAVLCLLFGVFAQMTANFYHAWYEMKSASERAFTKESLIYEDENDESGNPFMIRVLREACFSSFIISLAIGLGILAIAHQPWWFIIMGAFIYGQFVLLHLGKHPLINTPVAMVMTFLIFGPVGVISTSLIQSQVEAQRSIWALFDTAPSLFIGVGAGFLALTVHYIFSFANYLMSPDYNKFNLTRLVGPRAMIAMTFLNGVLMFVSIAAMVLMLRIDRPLLAVLPAFIGLIINTWVATQMYRGAKGDVRTMCLVSIANYVITFGLMLLVYWLISPPDDSYHVIF
ncbi:MAG: hypothetical protein K2M03_02935 [Muribaculaceae bacterium]|nr:hypothetical protein [Muribaculaceae bacterium]